MSMYSLPKLPYNISSLEPIISKEIMDLHYNKHHKTYLDKLNILIQEYDPTLFSSTNETTLAMYINTFPQEIRQKVKNHLGGHINHSFFWELLSKGDTSSYKKKLEPIFEKHFCSLDSALAEFQIRAKEFFGSGWVWICFNQITETIEIRSYQNQDCPLFESMYPLIGIDLWEHAYYLDYKNNKPEYIEKFMTIINWKYVYNLLESYIHNSESIDNNTKQD